MFQYVKNILQNNTQKCSEGENERVLHYRTQENTNKVEQPNKEQKERKSKNKYFIFLLRRNNLLLRKIGKYRNIWNAKEALNHR